MRKKILLLLIGLSSLSANARNLIDDYGKELYDVHMSVSKVGQLNRNDSFRRDANTDRRGISVRGVGVEYTVFKEGENGKAEVNKFPWGGYTVSSLVGKDNEFAKINKCSSMAMSILRNDKSELENDISMVATGLRKHNVFREPVALRVNRHKIYKIRKVIRVLKREIALAEKKKKDKVVDSLKKLLVNVEKKHQVSLKKRDNLLAKNKKWRKRRVVYVNANLHTIECSVEESKEKSYKGYLGNILRKIELLKLL